MACAAAPNHRECSNFTRGSAVTEHGRWRVFHRFRRHGFYLQLFEQINVLEAGISVTLVPAGPLPAPAVAQVKPLPPSRAGVLRGAGACVLRVFVLPPPPRLSGGNHGLPWAPGGPFLCGIPALLLRTPHLQWLQGDDGAPTPVAEGSRWARCQCGRYLVEGSPCSSGVGSPISQMRKLRLESLSRTTQLEGAELGFLQG